MAFVAVALGALAESVEEGGDGVAVPFLKAVAARVDAGAAPLIGEDGDLVNEVGVMGPAGRDHACGRVPDVFGVEPGDCIIEPLPEVLAELPLAACGRVPGRGGETGSPICCFTASSPCAAR